MNSLNKIFVDNLKMKTIEVISLILMYRIVLLSSVNQIIFKIVKE